jgi:hypothetical protein
MVCFGVIGEVLSVGCLGFKDHVKNAFYRLVEHGFIQLTAVDRCYNQCVIIASAAGHLQFQASL